MNPYFAGVKDRLPEIEQTAGEGGSIDAAELLFLTYALGQAVTGVRANYRRAMSWGLRAEIAETDQNRDRKYAVSPRDTDQRVDMILGGSYKISGLDTLNIIQGMKLN